MRSSSPIPLYMITMVLVLQVPGGKAFIHASCSHNSASLDLGALSALFGPPLTTEGLMGFLVEVRPANACQLIEGSSNSSSIFIALISWYNCSFTTKVFHAQWAGYHAAIVHNVNSQTLVSMMSEADAKQHIHIPSVFTTDVASKILKQLNRSGKLTSVILVPEYFHFTWKLGVICKFDEAPSCPFIQGIDEDVKENWVRDKALWHSTLNRASLTNTLCSRMRLLQQFAAAPKWGLEAGAPSPWPPPSQPSPEGASLWHNVLQALAAGEVIRGFGVGCHQYADDTQLYHAFSPDSRVAVEGLERCLEAVRIWMGANKLKLNLDKTEALLVPKSLM
ncbi:uncharacterized protein [Tiliqua scincoides]|uniref:uncharacterized protein n=1 Tax=Tiliqua scincoides TaxID=71010 RepID=UPI0034619EC6